MTTRMAMMLLATGAVVALAGCSSGTKGGGPVILPSISTDSPTTPDSTTTASGSSPSSAPATSVASASPSSSPSSSSSSSPSPSRSASSSPSALAGGACASSQLSLSLGESQGAAGSQIVPLVFTNTGSSACTLSGYPGVSFVTGSSGTQVGAPATRSGGAGTAVTLAAQGALASANTAQTLVKIANTENYPASTCSPTNVRGLRVYPPGQTAALFVALPDGSTACSASSVMQLSVQSVTSAS